MVKETTYFQEENVVVQTHILEETGHADVVVGAGFEEDSVPEEKSVVDIETKTKLELHRSETAFCTRGKGTGSGIRSFDAKDIRENRENTTSITNIILAT